MPAVRCTCNFVRAGRGRILCGKNPRGHVRLASICFFFDSVFIPLLLSLLFTFLVSSSSCLFLFLTFLSSTMTYLDDLVSLPDAPPNASMLFSELQQRTLNLDPSTPFADDYEYVSSIATYFVFLGARLRTEEAGRAALVQPSDLSTLTKEESIEYWKRMLQYQSTCATKTKELIDAKLQAHRTQGVRLPRIERCLDHLDLRGVEPDLFRCFVVSAVPTFQRDLASAYDPIEVCRLAGASAADLIEFARESRPIMTGGMFPEVMYSNVCRSSFNIEERMLKVLIGARVDEEDVIRLGDSFVRRIIDEENQTLEDDQAGASGAGEEGYDMLSDEADPSSRGKVTEETPAPARDDHHEGAHESVDLYEMLRREREREAELLAEMKDQQAAAGSDVKDETASTAVEDLQPYKTDLEYMDDYFDWTRQTIRLLEMSRRLAQSTQYRDMEAESTKREAEGKLKVIKTRIENRLKLTRERGRWLPRLERLAASKKLSEFEKNVLVVLIYGVMNPSYNSYLNSYSVRELLAMFAGESLQEQVRLSASFLKSAPLVSDGIIRVDASNNYILHAHVNIDRRMLDFLAGLDTDFSEVVEGSRLFVPTVDLTQVVLPPAQKELILRTIKNFHAFQRFKKARVTSGALPRAATGLPGAVSATGMNAGLVLLFHGPPGTGKTMCCHALAKSFEKSVLLIDYPSLEAMRSNYDNRFRSIFREAQLNDAIVFFDECENIFESRDHGNSAVNQLLIEIEKHPGIVILATNRRFELDEAMHRRITLAVEFLPPDRILREAIWRTHIPSEVQLDPSVRLDDLASKYELTGGFIKNAVLIAVTEAVSRNPENPVLLTSDLEEGASFQLRGAINMKLNGAVDSVIPSHGLDKVYVEESTSRILAEIVDFHKAQSVLYSQWGFAAHSGDSDSSFAIRAVFAGPSGTGKSTAAEGIAFELGIPIRVIHAREMMGANSMSASVIPQIFAAAQASGALVLIESLEETVSDQAAFSRIMHHVRIYRGIAIVCVDNVRSLDERLIREFSFIVKFAVPDARTRVVLFRNFVPNKLPMDADVDLAQAANLFPLTGLQIKRALMKAAARAALRKATQDRVVRMADIIRACQEEIEHSNIARSS